MMIELVRDRTFGDDINAGNIGEFEDAIAVDPAVCEMPWSPRRSAVTANLRALWRKSPLPARRHGAYDLPGGSESGCKFAVLLGPTFRRCAGFITGGRKAAYLFDATPPWTTPEEIVRFTREAGIGDLFVDHPQFVEPIQRLAGAPRVHFMPAAVNPADYRVSETRDIDVLEFGRKMPGYHDALVAGLGPSGIAHHHDFIDTRDGFLDCLGRARITISFPRSMTDGTTRLPMLTMRYFQAMASKSLIVGSAPPLLVELFGYNPVIEADLTDPVGQIRRILLDPGVHQELIERNHRNLLENHTYRHRWDGIKRILESSGC